MGLGEIALVFALAFLHFLLLVLHDPGLLEPERMFVNKVAALVLSHRVYPLSNDVFIVP